MADNGSRARCQINHGRDEVNGGENRELEDSNGLYG